MATNGSVVESVFSGYAVQVEATVWINSAEKIYPFKNGGGNVMASASIKRSGEQKNVSMPIRLTVFSADLLNWLYQQLDSGQTRFTVKGQLSLEVHTNDKGYENSGIFTEVVMTADGKPAKHPRTGKPFGHGGLSIVVDNFVQEVNGGNATYFLYDSATATGAVDSEEVVYEEDASDDGWAL